MRPVPTGAALGCLHALYLCAAWSAPLNSNAAGLPLPERAAGKPGFTRVPSALSGLVFTNALPAAVGATNRVLENGSGVAVGDFDGDGRADLFLAGLRGGSQLYRNLGNWQFTNATTSSGLDVLQEQSCRGAVFAEINGDAWRDLLVSTHAEGVRVFAGAGGGRFREVTRESGLGNTGPGTTTLALADVDDNGTLDLYVTRYRAADIRDFANVEARVVNGRTVLHPKYDGHLFIGPTGLLEYGEVDALYLGDGTGRFTAVPWVDGRFLDEQGRPLTEPPRDWGLSAAFRDFTGDGRPDLYVCNDYWTPDRIWINQGRGIFRAASAEQFRHTSENSMGVDFGDFDRDGQVDLFVTDMLARDPRTRRRQALAQSPVASLPGPGLDRLQFMRNALFLSRGDGTFVNLADQAGVGASDWSWQPLVLDVDLDGWEDLLVPSGHRKDLQDLDATERVRRLQRPWPQGLDAAARQRWFAARLEEHARLYPPYPGAVVAFRNRGDRTFSDATALWGLETPAVHQGAAVGDLDGDGDLDLVINVLDGEVVAYRNDAPAPRIVVRLEGLPANPDGIGARVTLVSGEVRQQREVFAGGQYLSGSEPLSVFAAGRGPRSVEVRWRDGTVSRLSNLESDHVYRVSQRDSSAAPAPPKETDPPAWFDDWTEQLGHEHREVTPPPGLAAPWPRGLGRRGPAVAWVDINDDGREDLLIGSGNEAAAVGVYTNTLQAGDTAFRPAGRWVASAVVSLGSLALPGSPVRWVAGLGAGDGGAAFGPVEASSPALGDPAAPPPVGSVSPSVALASVDFDGDGDLDLVAAGHATLGRYPDAMPTTLYVREKAGWTPHAPSLPVLASAGLVNGATWADLDGDGRPDLILATEWGPVRIYRSDGAQFVEVTDAWGFARWNGWWSGVAVGDFDHDGRLDLAASNWGWNTAYRATEAGPLLLYQGDFLQRGTVDVIGAAWESGTGRHHPVLGLADLQQVVPNLRQFYATHAAFAVAPVDEVLRKLGHSARQRSVQTLASSVFLQRDGAWERVELPAEAQEAPAWGIAAADFDGDGHDDLFLAQNCFDLPASVPRADAGLGLVLRGRGDGRFEGLRPRQAGVRLLGEQRGAAVADFDADGRVDLVVGQNAAPARLFRNRRAAPGLRVRLEGPPGNPAGVGATVQLRAGGRWGTARVLTAGTGFASQDSVVPVLTAGFAATHLRVRWPHSAEPVDHPIPPGAREVRVRPGGTLMALP